MTGIHDHDQSTAARPGLDSRQLDIERAAGIVEASRDTRLPIAQRDSSDREREGAPPKRGSSVLAGQPAWADLRVRRLTPLLRESQRGKEDKHQENLHDATDSIAHH